MHAQPGFVPGPGDELTTRTLPAFSGVVELLLPQRLAHADPGPRDAADHVQRHRAFDRVSADALTEWRSRSTCWLTRFGSTLIRASTSAATAPGSRISASGMYSVLTLVIPESQRFPQ